LEAFEWLWRTRPGDAPDLVIVGRPGWKTPALQEKLRSHAERGARLHWLTGVSDEGLCRLYDACTGVLIGSYGEGFGLPLVEAALFRRHVLARDLPVFREQRLPNVTYFIDESPAALAERLVELVSSGKAGPAPSATLPTWSHCVDGLLQEMGVSIEQYRETDSSLRRAS
jgi:glycosyltransferase involved in cell wall biosynthesis